MLNEIGEGLLRGDDGGGSTVALVTGAPFLIIVSPLTASPSSALSFLLN
jgi:hypothetical protein